MRTSRRCVAGLAMVLLVLACGPPESDDGRSDEGTVPAEVAAELSAEVERDVERIREATVAFQSLEAAVAAGYAGDVTHCIDNPPEGAMGYHHQNDALLDDRIELERPEMLVYERMPDGEYRLNGVEYIVPLSIWPQTEAPPVVMGQPLKPAPSLGIWYRHVWVWRDNPSGLFEDWNPLVTC